MYCVVLLFALPPFFMALKNQCVNFFYPPCTHPRLAWKVGILSMWDWVSYVIGEAYKQLSFSPTPFRGVAGGGKKAVGIGGGGVWTSPIHYIPYIIPILEVHKSSPFVLSLQFIYFLGTYFHTYLPVCTSLHLYSQTLVFPYKLNIWAKDRSYLAALS